MSVSQTVAKAVLSTDSDAIIAADRAGIIVFWNPVAEHIFGFVTSDAVGQSLEIIIPERLRKRHWDEYHQVMKTGESRYDHSDILAVPGIKKWHSALDRIHNPTSARRGRPTCRIGRDMRDVTQRFEEVPALKKMLVEAREVSR
jgi:PAS domain S-box-containing protein